MSRNARVQRTTKESDVLDHGVLIRETGPRSWLRVSIGTAAEMAAFRQALVEVAATAAAMRIEPLGKVEA